MNTIDDILHDKFEDDEYQNGMIEVSISYRNPHMKDQPKKNITNSAKNLYDGIVVFVLNLDTAGDFKKAIKNFFEDYCGDRKELYYTIPVDDIKIRRVSWLELSEREYNGYPDYSRTKYDY